MIRYRYRATDEGGAIHAGELTATSPDDLEARLARIGLMLIRHQSLNEGGGMNRLFWRREVSRRGLLLFCLHLEQVLRAGVPLLTGLGDFRDHVADRRMRVITAALIEDLHGGATLSEALEHHPRAFDPLFVRLVHMGERTGQLPTLLQSLAETLKWEDERHTRLRRMLIHPAIVGTAIGGLILFLMLFLVPKLLELIASLNETPPWHTRALIAMAGFVGDWWPLLPVLPVLLLIGLRMARVTSPTLRGRVDAALFSLHVIGPLIKKTIQARLAHALALLLEAGIPLPEALTLCGGLTDRQPLRDALEATRNHLLNGERIADAFANARLFPPILENMIRAGEASGAPAKGFRHIGYFLDREIQEGIGRLEQLTEPLLTLILGGMMGWVILSVLGPLYDLIARMGS
ncbi:Type II secretion system protein F [Candidatus Magnetaquicoccaceae bacterium FCR-1]|uniref:Type II secretion system protein F n=1 Tax=Candidatus Magnetaquiglobus chichijimensis TaxID=3141448 RepID=A0ABQ0C8J6_9PROT